MPVPFRDWLSERGLTFVEVPDDEFDSMGCNVLAIGSMTTPPRLTTILSISGESIRDGNTEILAPQGHGTFAIGVIYARTPA